MRRPNQYFGKIAAILAVLSIAALMPMMLTGLIAMPGGKQKLANANQDVPLNIEDLMKRVFQLNQNKEHQKAIDLLLATVDKQSDDSLVRTLLIQTFDLFLENEIKQGQADIQASPGNLSSYLRVSGALELIGDRFRAMEVLLNGLRHSPHAPELWMKIGRLELKEGRSPEALDVFREVTRLDGKNSDALNNAAYLIVSNDHCDADDLKEAETMASNARKIDPNNPEYLDTLAEVHFKQGNTKMAQSLIEEAIKLAPSKDTLKDQLRRFKGDVSFDAK